MLSYVNYYYHFDRYYDNGCQRAQTYITQNIHILFVCYRYVNVLLHRLQLIEMS